MPVAAYFKTPIPFASGKTLIQVFGTQIFLTVQASSGNINHLSFTFSTLQVPGDLVKKASGLAVNNKQSNSCQPIFKIPVEILCDIFTKYIEDERTPFVLDAPRPLVSSRCCADPIVLGQVCSTWRNTALNMPSLWSTIVIAKPKRSQYVSMNLWLERSRSSALTLSVVNSYDPEEDEIASSYHILSLLALHSARWQTIELRLSRDVLQLLNKILLADVKYDNLASISLQAYRGRAPTPLWEDVCLSEVWSFFYLSPALQKVTWHDIRGLKLSKNIPFSQLTHLDIYFPISADELLAVLGQCCAAEEINIFSLDRPLKDNYSSVVLPRLHTMSLHSHNDFAPLLSSLTLPSLDTLRLYYRAWSSGAAHDPQALQACLARSTSRLRVLLIQGSKIPEAHLEAYLFIPFLRSLLDFKFVGELSRKTLELFMQKETPNTPIIMPMLEKLQLSCIDGVQDSELRRVVLSRWHQPHSGSWRKVGSLRHFFLLSTASDYGITHESYSV